MSKLTQRFTNNKTTIYQQFSMASQFSELRSFIIDYQNQIKQKKKEKEAQF